MPIWQTPQAFYSLHSKLLTYTGILWLTSTSEEDVAPVHRLPSHYNPLRTFELVKGEGKHYQQQYGDMYFLRLATLKPHVEAIAQEAWADFQVHSVNCLNKLWFD